MNEISKLCLLLVSAALMVGCGDREKDRLVLDQQKDFYCPAGNEIAYEAWSEYGLMKVCVSKDLRVKNGSQFAAQGGQLRSKALYSQGEKAGGWTGYANDGKALPERGGYRSPSQIP
ncbi:hypothetical protein [Solilutibacter pythonis]|uniref:hypothetical protein n=1 Tax=Solilutibacter pythonis TaxID=2483112 RepID=UPI0011C3C861|nr:hypothetical protein [Lysobacter pythonis]